VAEGPRVKSRSRRIDLPRVDPDASDVERRHLKRHQTALPALVRTARETWQVEVTSVSKKGLTVRSLTLPPPETQVRIVLRIPPDCRFERGGKTVDSVEVVGSVRWNTDGKPKGSYRYPAFGFRIDEWSSDYQEFFERFLFARAADEPAAPR
jgi:hypothetical protein